MWRLALISLLYCGSVYGQETNEIKRVALLREEMKVLVYPNPSTGPFKIRGSKNGYCKIYSEIGTYVGTYLFGENEEIEIIDLTQGNYILQISNGAKSEIKRLIIL
jgi:hypothetical protein